MKKEKISSWKSHNRHKYLLQYHLIFVCKYRKKILLLNSISDDIKKFSFDISRAFSEATLLERKNATLVT